MTSCVSATCLDLPSGPQRERPPVYHWVVCSNIPGFSRKMPDFCQDWRLSPPYTSWCTARVVCGHVDTMPILWGLLQEKQSVGGQHT